MGLTSGMALLIHMMSALWAEDPWYNPEKRSNSYMYEGEKGQQVKANYSTHT